MAKRTPPPGSQAYKTYVGFNKVKRFELKIQFKKKSCPVNDYKTDFQCFCRIFYGLGFLKNLFDGGNVVCHAKNPILEDLI